VKFIFHVLRLGTKQMYNLRTQPIYVKSSSSLNSESTNDVVLWYNNLDKKRKQNQSKLSDVNAVDDNKDEKLSILVYWWS